MPTYVLVILCITGLLTALAGLPMMLAAADPEGRGGDLALSGIACLFGGAVLFLGFGVWALVRMVA